MINHGETTICKTGIMVCIGGENWGACENQVLPTAEICDGLDNDCDGIIDNNAIDGNACGGCDGEPIIEICDNNIDDNCDGFIDENCPVDNCNNPTEEVCDGADNDCDGLTDEGLLNACGKCSGSCYEINIGDDTDNCTPTSADYPDCNNNIDDGFDGGEFDGVGVDPEDPTKLTLDSSVITNNYLWVANSASDTVTQIDTSTNQVIGHFDVGNNPSRTAVERDGSVWVANRDDNTVYKLKESGEASQRLDFIVDLTPYVTTNKDNCGPRGVAIDKDGNAWIGCRYPANNAKIFKVSPTGEILFQYQTDASVYGFAIDSNGILWSSMLGGTKVFRINTNLTPDSELHSTDTTSFYKSFDLASYTQNAKRQTYGIVIDKNNDIWYGGWTDHDIKKVNYNPSNDTITAVSLTSGGLSHARGIAVDSLDHVWCSFSSSNKILKLDLSGNIIDTYNTGGTSPIGVGVDNDNNIWVMNYSSDNAVKLGQDGVILTTKSVQSRPYSYSDITGFNLRNITTQTGTFKTIIDTERGDAVYDSISWDGTTPNGSSIKIRARVSNNRNDFLDPTTPEWSNFVTTSGASLIWSSGNTPSGRYIQLEVVMNIGLTDDDKPTLSNIQVNWQRP